MFSSFFAKDPLKDFPYEVNLSNSVLTSGDANVRSSSYWSLHTARKRSSKVDADEYSAFVFLTQDKSPSQIQLAKQTFRRFKTLRHPNLLAYIDGVETEKAMYIVTNRIVPLSTYLETNADKCNLSFLASWGIYQVCKAVTFLNNDCKLAHCNLNSLSIFVTRKGEWKVGAFDFCIPLDGSLNAQEIEVLRFAHLERFAAPEQVRKSTGRSKSADELSTQLLAADSFGLACIIYEIFNPSVSEPLREMFSSSDRRRQRVPAQIAHFDDLCASDYRARVTVDDFAERNSKPEGFFSNFFVSALLFVEEMALKSPAEISRFLSRLDAHLDAFPSDVRENKILAQLLDLFNLYASKAPASSAADPASGTGSQQPSVAGDAQSVQSALLTPIIKIGRSLSVDAFQKQITPCLIRMFASPDRQTRVKLLESMPSFVEFLSPNVVNDQLFSYVLQGFSDAHALVRDATIKGSCLLRDKLNARNLDELTKHLGRVQARDPEGGVRTNAIVCLAKLAGHVAPKTRQSLVLAAFLRATKDQFGPARLSAIGALQQTNVFYPLRDLALKVLPCCTPLLVDPVKGVRDASFRLIRTCIEKLEKVSENPEVADQLERDLNTIQTGDSSQSASGSAADSSAGWSGWALNTLSSKFYKVSGPTDKKTQPSSTAPDGTDTVATTAQKSDDFAKSDSASESGRKQQAAKTVGSSEDGWGSTEDAWGASDWGSMRDSLQDQTDADLESFEDFDATPKSNFKPKGAERKRLDNETTQRTASPSQQKATKSTLERDESASGWAIDEAGWPDSDWSDERTSRSTSSQKDTSSAMPARVSKPVVSDSTSWQQASVTKTSDWNSDAFFEDIATKPKPKTTTAPILKAESSKRTSNVTTTSSQSKAKQTSDDDGWSNW